MQQFYQIKPIGVNIDIAPIEAGDSVWSEALNMVPKPGAMVRARGYEAIYGSPLFPPIYLQYSPQLGVQTWMYCGSSNIGSIDQSGVHRDLTPDSLSSPVAENGWTGGNLNGLAVLNAVENEPYYWFAGQSQAQPLPGQRPNTRYRIMRPFKYHLVGLGYTDSNGDFRDGVQWSTASDPGQIPSTWVPAAENEAGDNFLADENGDIIDGLALRDSFYIYKQDSVYEMTYTGGVEVMRFRKVFGTVGVLTRNCVVRVKGTHVVLGNGDIYRHDGQNMSSIVDGVIRRKFFATIDATNFANSFCLYSESEEEVWFCVPTTGNTRPNLALVWNVTTGAFGYRSIPDADFAATGVITDVIPGGENWESDAGQWNADTSAWLETELGSTEDRVLIADAQKSQLYAGNTTTYADGEAYESRVSKYGLAFDAPYAEKILHRVWPHISGPSDTVYTLTLFNQRDPRAPLEQVYKTTFLQGTEGVPVTAAVRYGGVRIETQEGVDWEIAGVDFEAQIRGRF